MRIIHILLLAVLHALLIPLCEAGRKGAHFKIMQKQKVLAGAADTIAASKRSMTAASTKARAAISANRMKRDFSTGASIKSMDPMMKAFKQRRSRSDEWDDDSAAKK